jgi:hypothetical protein
MAILPISTSQVAEITVVRHHDKLETFQKESSGIFFFFLLLPVFFFLFFSSNTSGVEMLAKLMKVLSNKDKQQN